MSSRLLTKRRARSSGQARRQPRRPLLHKRNRLLTISASFRNCRTLTARPRYRPMPLATRNCPMRSLTRLARRNGRDRRIMPSPPKRSSLWTPPALRGRTSMHFRSNTDTPSMGLNWIRRLLHVTAAACRSACRSPLVASVIRCLSCHRLPIPPPALWSARRLMSALLASPTRWRALQAVIVSVMCFPAQAKPSGAHNC